MSRYIDANILKKHGFVLAKIKTNKSGEVTEIMTVQIDDAPTADVVPKSETTHYPLMSKSWAMPNSKTFRIAPIKAFVEKYIAGAKVIVDPFANDCKYGTITNDLNPEFDTDFHMDALEFLKTIPSESADVVLYDPPYSLRQVSECYKGVGREVTMETTQASWRARHLDEIQRITKRGGVVLCFGWNSAGVGKKRGFEQVEILLVAHGGSKNDTICSAEIKR